MKIGIVVSKWYWDEITGPMLELAQSAAKEEGVEVVVLKVPGSFDVPMGAQRLLQQNVDGVVTLGAIVQGDTAHDEVIGYAVAHALQNLMLEFKKPIMLGVTGPRMTFEQAKNRVPMAREYMRACIEMVRDGS